MRFVQRLIPQNIFRPVKLFYPMVIFWISEPLCVRFTKLKQMPKRILYYKSLGVDGDFWVLPSWRKKKTCVSSGFADKAVQSLEEKSKLGNLCYIRKQQLTRKAPTIQNTSLQHMHVLCAFSRLFFSAKRIQNCDLGHH